MNKKLFFKVFLACLLIFCLNTGVTLALETFSSSSLSKTMPSGLETELQNLPEKPILLKEVGSPTIYLKMAQQVVAPIANLETLKKVAPKPTPITSFEIKGKYKIDAPITESRITTDNKLLPSIKPVNLNNRLIKQADDPKVYFVDNCNKKQRIRHIKDWSTFVNLSFKAENIETVGLGEIKKYSLGPEIDQQEMVVTYQDGTTVYKKINDQLLPYRHPDELIQDQKDWCDIITLPPRNIPVLIEPKPIEVKPIEPIEKPNEEIKNQGLVELGESFMDISLYQPADYGYGYPRPGINKGFIAFKTNSEAIYRALEGSAWRATGYYPQALKDSLTLCQKYFPGTYFAQAMSNYGFKPAWFKYSGLTENESWYLYSCLVPPDEKSPVGASPDAYDLGTISYWYGKVNKFTNNLSVSSLLSWQTDPDGVSGGNLDTLDYCKKWFPATKSVQYIGNTASNDWKDRGLKNSHKGGGNAYACRSTTANLPALPEYTTLKSTD